MNIPTIKRMQKFGFSPDEATKIRAAMEGYYRKHPFGDRRPRHTLAKISDIMNGEGVEEVPEGNNQRSPFIMYVNTGDLYHWTVMWVNGRFQIGDVGSIIERGNYN